MFYTGRSRRRLRRRDCVGVSLFAFRVLSIELSMSIRYFLAQAHWLLLLLLLLLICDCDILSLLTNYMPCGGNSYN